MKALSFCLLVSMIAISAVVPAAFAQDDSAKAPAAPQAITPAPTTAAPAAMTAKEEPPKPAEYAIYGEVQSVNAQANSMTVQYYDYDNDEEKSTEIMIDGSTKLENAKAIAEINKGDWVDVSYSAVAGKNVAKMVSVEKEEPAMDENAPASQE